MAIRLETAKRSGITNHQDTELSSFHLNWAKDIGKSHPNAKPRTGPSAQYNCHGLTFASRRTRIELTAGLQLILKEDSYKEIHDMKNVLPGDVVIYCSDRGDMNHSGIIVEAGNSLIVPIVCSKWGNAGEFIHALGDCPVLYGPLHRFFRCNR